MANTDDLMQQGIQDAWNRYVAARDNPKDPNHDPNSLNQLLTDFQKLAGKNPQDAAALTQAQTGKDNALGQAAIDRANNSATNYQNQAYSRDVLAQLREEQLQNQLAMQQISNGLKDKTLDVTAASDMLTHLDNQARNRLTLLQTQASQLDNALTNQTSSQNNQRTETASVVNNLAPKFAPAGAAEEEAAQNSALAGHQPLPARTHVGGMSGNQLDDMMMRVAKALAPAGSPMASSIMRAGGNTTAAAPDATATPGSMGQPGNPYSAGAAPTGNHGAMGGPRPVVAATQPSPLAVRAGAAVTPVQPTPPAPLTPQIYPDESTQGQMMQPVGDISPLTNTVNEAQTQDAQNLSALRQEGQPQVGDPMSGATGGVPGIEGLMNGLSTNTAFGRPIIGGAQLSNPVDSFDLSGLRSIPNAAASGASALANWLAQFRGTMPGADPNALEDNSHPGGL